MATYLIAESCQILAAKPINAPKTPTPSAPPVLPDNQDLLSLDPPPYQVPPLIPQAAPIPAAPAEPPVAQPIGELENREAQPAPKPSGGKVQGPPDIPERKRIQLEARELVPGDDGQPTANLDLINAAFPLTRPPQDGWDYNTAEGRGRLRIYRQTLMAGLRAAARKPTNLAKVYSVIQGKTESPAAYLKRLIKTFRQYTPMNPEAPENQAAVVMAFVNQAATDIKKKLQKLKDLEGKQIQDLVRIAQRGGRGLDPLPEPRVTLQVEGNPVQFLVDTGAQHSVLIRPHEKISKKSSWVQGATGIKKYPWTTQRTVDLGNGKVTHSFLVIPDSPCPLLGKDLLTKMEAQIHFTPGGPQVTGPHNQPITTLTLRSKDEYRLHQGPPSQSQNIEPWLQQFPGAWAETGGMGLAKHRPALFIELKPGADPVRVRQYPMSMEARNGITPHIRRLLDLGILRPCHSAWNTPLLPVRKPNSADYRPVQDLREVNRRVMDIHPTVPNPYTLLSALSPERQWYTVLDLKDAFFSLPLAPKSQELFAFEWSDPERGINGQLTWTRLPQGFKNSPTLFDEALHEDLGEYRNQNPKVTLLQYVDDLLIAAETAEACLQGTKNLLRTLGALGYRASAKKAQICRSEVTFLG
ncbi:uncharacterized protein LOC122218484 [Panthera leo]|uniref:uncharacterized protein LOC122218484 n=1 Tax=Panthera leo TaxID=9689 RepID=UPI001C698B5C|nr:uncharacterized protein LOC122218484 [Panthera leo]